MIVLLQGVGDGQSALLPATDCLGVALPDSSQKGETARLSAPRSIAGAAALISRDVARGRGSARDPANDEVDRGGEDDGAKNVGQQAAAQQNRTDSGAGHAGVGDLVGHTEVVAEIDKVEGPLSRADTHRDEPGAVAEMLGEAVTPEVAAAWTCSGGAAPSVHLDPKLVPARSAMTPLCVPGGQARCIRGWISR